MDCSASTKSAYLHWSISTASADLLTCRRRLADRAQTLPQTLPQTLARQEGRKGIVLPEDGERGAWETNPTGEPQNAHFLVQVWMVGRTCFISFSGRQSPNPSGEKCDGV
jgi:hypothetical protein